MRQEPLRQEARPETRQEPRQETSTLDSGQEACGILEVMPDGFGFIRSDNYMPGDSVCLRFSVPNPPFRTENGRYHPRKHVE